MLWYNDDSERDKSIFFLDSRLLKTFIFPDKEYPPTTQKKKNCAHVWIFFVHENNNIFYHITQNIFMDCSQFWACVGNFLSLV